ncbi:hypothetical protein [Clostridium perfringens]|uniref:Uncharacterized protein n=1 Tax=Clostridium perfringens TaxID=1502 RepID=A0A133MJ38_CLOPF|nr:hypothetical protein [Clostridium perfringens]EGT3601250.1 hypothetical protein [Clostridium perfringens]KXA04067.1 hypothetical protein HMPREF3222_03242 [Clostridium perfringens]
MLSPIMYLDICRENNEVIFKGASFGLNLKRNDPRLMNLDEKYKEFERQTGEDFLMYCVCYIVYDVIKDKYYLSDKMYFVGQEGEDICFGKLTVDEKSKILKKVEKRKCLTHKLKAEYIFEILDFDEFKEYYEKYFKEDIFLD